MKYVPESELFWLRREAGQARQKYKHYIDAIKENLWWARLHRISGAYAEYKADMRVIARPHTDLLYWRAKYENCNACVKAIELRLS